MIKVSGLKKRYISEDKTLVVLNDLSFHIQKGEFVCVVGASGSGKSTLLRCISGMDTDCEGDILINNEPHHRYLQNKSIAFVSQSYSNFPWLTVEQNVQLGNPKADQVVIQKTLKRLGLFKFKDYFPAQLSGGMRQRVAIARALTQDTEIIFFDEPFGALDVQTRSQIQQLLLHIWEEEKKTIIFVTHDIDEAIFLADRVLILSSDTGTLQQEISIDLPRPRESDIQFTSAFTKLKKSIAYSIRTESIKASLKTTPEKEETCRLGLFIWSGNAPWYHATETNIFNTHGLHANIISTDSNEGNLEKLLKDEVDVLNVTLDYAIRSIHNHPELQMILPLNYSNGGDALMALPEIKEIHDLKGKRVGIEKNAVSHFFLQYLLQKNSMTPKEIIEVDLHGGDIGSALIRGDIDAAVLWEPWLSKAMELSGSTILASTKEKKHQILYDVLIAKKTYTKTHPEVVHALSSIWADTINTLNRQQLVSSAASSMGISEKEVEASLKNIRFIKTYTKDFLLALNNIQKFYLQTKLIDSLLDEETLIGHP